MQAIEGRTRQAEQLLRDTLAGGPLPARTVEARATAAGVTRGTLTRARYRLGVVAAKERTERGAWLWALPTTIKGEGYGIGGR